MSYNDQLRGEWEIPFGPVGLGAMAIVGAGAFTLGQFTFYGLEFLPYWHLIGGWSVSLGIFAAAFGTLGECLIWNGRLGRGSRFLRSWHPTRRALLAAGILAVLAIAAAIAHRQSECLLFAAPPLFLIVFAVAVRLQEPILLALRRVGRPGAALAALLMLEAGIMFGIGEWMAVDAYSKGLKHFEKERQAYWSISTTDRTDFHIDYSRQQVVLRTHTFAGEPVEISRSIAGFCR